MTLEEKAKLLCGGTFFGTNGVESEGIPAIKLLDGGTGMNFEQLIGDCCTDLTEGYSGAEIDNVTQLYFDDDKLTDREKELRDKIINRLCEKTGFDTIAPGCYPPGILLGATWNPETCNKVGKALGMEALVYRISILLGTPNVNLLRDPRNGRFFEGYSEDPYLAGQLAPALAEGVESMGVASNTKHFAANNLEYNRIGIDQQISQRTLREMYFPAFEKHAKIASTYMASYPSINGKPCTENDWLINKVLRDEWGFEGIVMTDWGACTGKESDSVRCGIDLIMPGPWNHEDIVEAVKDGRLSEEIVDLGVSRMLKTIQKFKDVKKPEDLTFEDYIRIGDEACYESVVEGTVLLKNNNCLPISDESKVTIFGNKFRNCGDGSAQVFTPRQGQFEFKNISYNDYNVENKTTCVVVCSMPSAEGTDRVDLKMDEETIKTIKSLAEIKKEKDIKVVLILNTPGPVELGDYIDNVDSILACFYPGMMGKKALTDIMLGKVNPSGALPCTFPVKYEDTPAFLCYPDSYTCLFGEGIYVGYRGYQKRKMKPQFPFGFGLSYSDFKLSDIKLSKDEYKNGEEIVVTFSLENLSDMAGKKVVQIYSSDPESIVNKAPFELRAFGKFYLEGHEKKEFKLSFSSEDLKFFAEDIGKFVVEDGYYDISVGFSCDELSEPVRFYLCEGSDEIRPGGNWSFEQIKVYPELFDALLESVKDLGKDTHEVTNQIRYTPFNKLSKIYPEWKEMTKFNEAVKNFRRP